MNALEFFDKVLPDAGLRTLGIKAARGMPHLWGPSNEWAAVNSLAIDANRGIDVYIGCASFKEDGSRKAENVHSVRSLWVDLDVEAGDDKKYDSQFNATLALRAFCTELKLPCPLVVNSGGGLHAWWPLVADIDPAEWKPLAKLLKASAKAWGLKADPTRTADIASVLRIPGTRNHKRLEPGAVRVICDADPADADALRRLFEAYMTSQGIGADEEAFLPPGGPARPLPVTNDLSAGMSAGPWFDHLTPQQKDTWLTELLTSDLAIAASHGTRDEWIKAVAACARSGAPSARQICRRWSQLSDKFELGGFDSTFSSFESRP